jgi:cell division protein FtsN
MSDTREPDFVASEEDQILPEGPDPGAPSSGPEDARPRARLLPMWILIAAVVIVGVAWAMSERYFGPTEDNKSVPVIVADATPVKVRPEEPGGVDVPDRDKYVYKSLTDEEPEAEQLLPPPEEPMERPPIEVVEVAPPEPVEEVTQAVEVEEVTQAVEVAMEAVVEETPEPPSPAELTVVELTEPAEAPEVRVPETAPEPIPQEAAALEEPKAAPPPEPELTSAAPQQSAALSASSGSFLVQIGAAKNEASANGEIARLAKKHPDIFAGLSGVVIRVDLGAKGVWYRMRVGPFANRGEAGGVCGQLKAVDVGCFVVAN